MDDKKDNIATVVKDFTQSIEFKRDEIRLKSFEIRIKHERIDQLKVAIDFEEKDLERLRNELHELHLNLDKTGDSLKEFFNEEIEKIKNG